MEIMTELRFQQGAQIQQLIYIFQRNVLYSHQEQSPMLACVHHPLVDTSTRYQSIKLHFRGLSLQYIVFYFYCFLAKASEL